jgi:glycosyltransferase involved in cell wall biosynthesis
MNGAVERMMFVTASLAHGGAERHSVTLLNRFAERRHECHAVYIKREAGLLDRIRLGGAGTVRCLDAARYLDLRALRRFAAHLRAIRPQVIVAANPYALMYSWLALRLARLRSALVVTYHSTRLLGAKEQLQMLLYRLLFWSADCLVFVCETQRRHWLRRGVFARRVCVIHNGVDTDEFRDRWSAAERQELRRSLGFADADYVIGAAAGLRPEKNHVQLVEAVAALRGAGIPARALLIGDGEMRAAIESRARALGIERDVVITGFRNDVRPYMAACDVVASCSVTEALPLAALEAMAMGRPVVHSEVGGAAEMIAQGWNGFLFPAGDTRRLVARLVLLAGRALRESVGRNARQVALTHFSEKSMVERYEEVLLEVSRAGAGAVETALPR